MNFKALWMQLSMKWYSPRGCAFFLLCLVTIPCYSIESYDKFWGLITYNDKYKQFFYTIEPQIRLVNLPGAYDQFLLNTGGGVEVMPKLQLWFGQTIANASPYNVEEDVSPNDLNEYRLWQQLLWRSDPVIIRSRLEERYSLENAPWSVRLRERIYWTKKLTEKQSLVLSDELLVNLKTTPWIVTSTLDQNRAYLGILHQLSPRISINFSYMNQYIFRLAGAESNHALVVNVFINMPV